MNLIARLTGLDGRLVGRRAGWAFGGFVAAALLAGVSLGFLGLALLAALAPALGTAGAALCIALLGALLTALVFALARMALTRTRREVGSAVRANALVSLAPPLLGLASRRGGVLGVIALGVFTLMMARRD